MRMHVARQGMAVVFVVGMLALLAVMGVGFSATSLLELNLGRNYVDRSRAELAAESGVEAAIARLLPYAGKAPTAEFLEAIRYESPEDGADPLAGKCSFEETDEEGARRFPSRSLTFPEGFVRLRVDSEDGKLNLNDTNGKLNIDTDPWEDGGADNEDDEEDQRASVGRLWNIVRELTRIVLGAGHDEDIGATVADAIFNRRAELPGGVFASIDEVRDVLVPAELTEAEYDRLAAHWTLRSWQDPHTIRPVFQLQVSRLWDQMPGWKRGAPNREPRTLDRPDRTGKSFEEKNTVGTYGNIYLTTDWQASPDRYLLEPRCPVNINRVSPELLEALIRPVDGWCLVERRAGMTSIDFRAFAVRAWRGVKGPTFCYAVQDSFAPYNVRSNENPLSAATYVTEEAWQADPTVSRFAEPFPVQNYVRQSRGVDWDVFPARLARLLHDRIHGTGATGGNPIETMEELEWHLRQAVDALLPNETLIIPGHEFFPRANATSNTIRRWGANPPPLLQQEGGATLSRYGWWDLPGSPFSSRFSGAMYNWQHTDLGYWGDRFRGLVVDLLMANFNPNTRSSAFNADRHGSLAVDKTHVTAYTTELCFQTSGYFTIRSEAYLRDSEEGAARARSTCLAEVELWMPFRVTTQEQFMRGFETPRAFGADPAVEFEAPPVQWNSMIASYPEPLLRDADGNADARYFPRSIFDGSIAPSTWREDETTRHGGSAITFMAHFEGGFDPDFRAPQGPDRGGAVFMLGNPDRKWLHSGSSGEAVGIVDWGWPTIVYPRKLDHPVTQPGGANGTFKLRNLPSTASLTVRESQGAPSPLPGNLFPDGALSDAGRGLAYPASNFGSDQGRVGAVEFWFKPNFDPSFTSRIRCIFDLSKDAAFSPGAATPYTALGVWFFPHFNYHSNEIGTASLASHVKNPDLPYTEPWLAICPSSFAFSIMGTKNGFNPSSSLSDTGLGFESHVTTPTTVSRYPHQVLGQRSAHHQYYFEAHQWSHIVIGWNVQAGSAVAGRSRNPASQLLIINGRNPVQDEAVANAYAADRIGTGTPPPLGTPTCYIHQDAGTLARFGGLGSSSYSNYVGDITVDEIIGYATANVPHDATTAYAGKGRYYSPAEADQEAVYQSPGFDVFEECGIQGGRATVLAAAWTGYWPRYNERRNYKSSSSSSIENPHLRAQNLNDLDGEDPLKAIRGWAGADDPFSFDIAIVRANGTESWACDMDGDADLYDDHGRTYTYAGGTTLATRRDGAPLRMARGETLRFRTYFNQAPGQIVYEAPVLDDVTFTIGVFRVLYWDRR